MQFTASENQLKGQNRVSSDSVVLKTIYKVIKNMSWVKHFLLFKQILDITLPHEAWVLLYKFQTDAMSKQLLTVETIFLKSL